MDKPVSSKPYLLKYELRPHYLYVYIKCKYLHYEIAHAYWEDIVEIAEETASKRILMEKDIPAQMAAADVYRIGSEVARSKLRSVKIAVYDPLTSEEIRKLGETVWVNRSLYGRVFGDLTEAEDWLLGR